MTKQTVLFQDLGNMGYAEAWAYQEGLLAQNLELKRVAREQFPDDHRPIDSTTHHLLFVEHPPVYTLGKSGHMSNVLLSEDELKERGIAFFQTNRGGDITYHGPGQLVGYPVLDLERYYTDIGRYLRNVEEVSIRTLASYGIEGQRSPGETGVWIQPDVKGRERKICAIGVRSSRWITIHGFALNVNNDLSFFDHIIPCGIRDKGVTSIAKELGHPVQMEEVKQRMRENFETVFESRLVMNEAITSELLGQ